MPNSITQHKAKQKQNGDLSESFDFKKQQLEIQRLEKENIKIEIETQKIQLEKQELQKKWYLKPSWWSIIVPLFIGFGSIGIAFFTGIISVEQLKKEKAGLSDTLKVQKQFIENFGKVSDSLKKSLVILQQANKRSTDSINSLSVQKDVLKKSIQNIKAERDTVGKKLIKEKQRSLEKYVQGATSGLSVTADLSMFLVRKFGETTKLISPKELRKAIDSFLLDPNTTRGIKPRD